MQQSFDRVREELTIMSGHYSFCYCYVLVVIGTMDLDWQHIHHMAKWICIFCFEMKGPAVFDCRLVCIKCFKNNTDFFRTMPTCQCGATFPESSYNYIVTHTHTGKMAAGEIL